MLSSIAAEKTIGASEALLRFRFASVDCNACHADPHGIDPQAKLPCGSCHTPQQWKSLLPFDHSSPRFKLEGAHKDAATDGACIRCHKTSVRADGTPGGTAPVFSGVSNECSRCHQEKEPHGGQFSSPGQEHRDCSSCHSPTTWNAVIFDHSRTRFALNGAHDGLSCAKCHKDREVNGKIVRVYKDTPFDCLNCHA